MWQVLVIWGAALGAVLQPAAATVDAPVASASRGEGSTAVCQQPGALSDMAAADRPTSAALHGLRLSGWTAMSFTASTARRDHLPMGFNDRANQFLLQQNWLRFERPVDSEAGDPGFGFRCDTILPGSDYRFTVARGLWDGQLRTNRGQPNLYGIDPVQFYVQAQLPGIGRGLDVKLGRFFAPYGIESIAATQTPLASRSYSFIYNPFTQTGLLTTVALDESWSMTHGLVMGNDVFLDPAASPYYVGGPRWSPENSRTSVEFTAILGSGRFDRARQFHNPQVFHLLVTTEPVEKLSWSLDGLYGYTDNVPGIGFANWYGLNNYLVREFTDTLSGTARWELFDDAQGHLTGTAGLYTGATTGLAYRVRPWLLVRPEVRLDHHRRRPFEGAPLLFTAALELLVQW